MVKLSEQLLRQQTGSRRLTRTQRLQQRQQAETDKKEFEQQINTANEKLSKAKNIEEYKKEYDKLSPNLKRAFPTPQELESQKQKAIDDDVKRIDYLIGKRQAKLDKLRDRINRADGKAKDRLEDRFDVIDEELDGLQRQRGNIVAGKVSIESAFKFAKARAKKKQIEIDDRNKIKTGEAFQFIGTQQRTVTPLVEDTTKQERFTGIEGPVEVTTMLKEQFPSIKSKAKKFFTPRELTPKDVGKIIDTKTKSVREKATEFFTPREVTPSDVGKAIIDKGTPLIISAGEKFNKILNKANTFAEKAGEAGTTTNKAVTDFLHFRLGLPETEIQEARRLGIPEPVSGTLGLPPNIKPIFEDTEFPTIDGKPIMLQPQDLLIGGGLGTETTLTPEQLRNLQKQGFGDLTEGLISGRQEAAKVNKAKVEISNLIEELDKTGGKGDLTYTQRIEVFNTNAKNYEDDVRRFENIRNTLTPKQQQDAIDKLEKRRKLLEKEQGSLESFDKEFKDDLTEVDKKLKGISIDIEDNKFKFRRTKKEFEGQEIDTRSLFAKQIFSDDLTKVQKVGLVTVSAGSQVLGAAFLGTAAGQTGIASGSSKFVSSLLKDSAKSLKIPIVAAGVGAKTSTLLTPLVKTYKVVTITGAVGLGGTVSGVTGFKEGRSLSESITLAALGGGIGAAKTGAFIGGFAAGEKTLQSQKILEAQKDMRKQLLLAKDSRVEYTLKDRKIGTQLTKGAAVTKKKVATSFKAAIDDIASKGGNTAGDVRISQTINGKTVVSKGYFISSNGKVRFEVFSPSPTLVGGKKVFIHRTYLAKKADIQLLKSIESQAGGSRFFKTEIKLLNEVPVKPSEVPRGDIVKSKGLLGKLEKGITPFTEREYASALKDVRLLTKQDSILFLDDKGRGFGVGEGRTIGTINREGFVFKASKIKSGSTFNLKSTLKKIETELFVNINKKGFPRGIIQTPPTTDSGQQVLSFQQPPSAVIQQPQVVTQPVGTDLLQRVGLRNIDVFTESFISNIKTGAETLALGTAVKNLLDLRKETALRDELKQINKLAQQPKQDIRQDIKAQVTSKQAPRTITEIVPPIIPPIIPPGPPPIIKPKLPKLTAFPDFDLFGRPIKKKKKRKTEFELAFFPGFTSKALGLEPAKVRQKDLDKLVRKIQTGFEIRRPVQVIK